MLWLLNGLLCYVILGTAPCFVVLCCGALFYICMLIVTTQWVIVKEYLGLKFSVSVHFRRGRRVIVLTIS